VKNEFIPLVRKVSHGGGFDSKGFDDEKNAVSSRSSCILVLVAAHHQIWMSYTPSQNMGQTGQNICRLMYRYLGDYTLYVYFNMTRV
jgi:hypothetical protein